MTKQELWETVAIANAGDRVRAVVIADAICDAWHDRFVPKPEEKARLLITSYRDWLSVRTENALARADINYIDQLDKLTDAQLLRIKNLGRRSLNEIRELLADLNAMEAEKVSE